MGKKSSPKAPDPYQTAQAQSQANKEAILTSALVNRYDQETPWGTVSWERPGQQAPAYTGYGGWGGNYGSYYNKGFGGDPTSAEGLSGWKQVTKLSEPMQRQFDQQNELASTLGDMAINRSKQIDTDKFSLSGLPDLETGYRTNDYTNDASKLEKATYDRAMMLMNPQFEDRKRELDNRMSVMGLPAGGEAYGKEMDRYDRMRNEAELAAALDSVGAGRQEQSRLFGIDQAKFGMSGSERDRAVSETLLERTQPMNELAAILQGSPALNSPQAAQTAQYQAAPPDISGMIQNNYNQKAANASAAKNGTSSLIGALGSAGIMMSDRRLKRNISHIGQFKEYPVYRYQYLWNDDWNIGVMADEVEQINPSAVVTMGDGYKAVDYGAL